jgi:hypothetical protein
MSREAAVARLGDPESRAAIAPNAQKRPANAGLFAFSRAAEGIRTLDLLHGKQNV